MSGAAELKHFKTKFMTAYIYQDQLTDTVYWGEIFSEEVIEIDYDIIQESEEVECHGFHTIITEEIVLNKAELTYFGKDGLHVFTQDVTKELGDEIIEKIKNK